MDAVHGHDNVIGAVVFPHNIALGATRNPKLVEEVSRMPLRILGVSVPPRRLIPKSIHQIRQVPGNP